MAQRVKQEVAIHSKLKHPSILELYTFFEDANNVYLVLELAQNGELHRYMKDNQRVMTEAETATILVQVVNGLLYLKSQNILHRDLSLSNLLLTKDLQVKIADFGLATQLRRPDEKHMTLCGTPNYISPEVASRAAHGLPVDVWGVGCMMYTLLVGKPPFDTDGIRSTLTRVVMVDFSMPSYLSMEAKDLLNRLLCKNQYERIHIDAVLAHPFLTRYANDLAYSNRIASVDSGLVTMSSGMVSQNAKSGAQFGRTEQQHQYQSDRHDQAMATAPSTSQYSIFDHLKGSGQERNAFEGNNVMMRYENIENSLFGKPIGDATPANAFAYERPENASPMVSQRTHFDSDFIMHINRLLIFQIYQPILPKPYEIKAPTPVQKMDVPPFTTDRLLPTRHTTKNAILSILSSGEVVIEFTKFKSKYNENRVVDVCRITKDGLRIVIYQPDAGR